MFITYPLIPFLFTILFLNLSTSTVLQQFTVYCCYSVAFGIYTIRLVCLEDVKEMRSIFEVLKVNFVCTFLLKQKLVDDSKNFNAADTYLYTKVYNIFTLYGSILNVYIDIALRIHK